MNRYLLVMTACVDPSKGHYPLRRADPKVRLEDYKGALRYWLAHSDKRIENILFIENSAYPLDELKTIAKQENRHQKDIEFVSLDCNFYPPGGHYGQAELRLLDLGLQQSQLKNSATHMIKVSGRLIFPAISELLDRLPDEFDAAVDSRAWRTPFQRLARPNVTTQITLFALDFYKAHLQECYKEMGPDKETHMEGIFYMKLAELSPMYKVIFRFPCNVPPIGFAAYSDRSYMGASRMFTNQIRAVARRVLPNWWF